MNKYSSFGEMLKSTRLNLDLTLRQCAGELKIDPSNWSKLEREVTPAPKDAQLERWMDYLKVSGDDRQHFMDLAALSRKELPSDLASDETVIAALPAFFRAVRGHELKGAVLDQFIEDLRVIHSPTRD
jgi:transcriptional regulator with XRE-family HTH domain